MKFKFRLLKYLNILKMKEKNLEKKIVLSLERIKFYSYEKEKYDKRVHALLEEVHRDPGNVFSAFHQEQVLFDMVTSKKMNDHVIKEKENYDILIKLTQEVKKKRKGLEELYEKQKKEFTFAMNKKEEEELYESISKSMQ